MRDRIDVALLGERPEAAEIAERPVPRAALRRPAIATSASAAAPDALRIEQLARRPRLGRRCRGSPRAPAASAADPPSRRFRRAGASAMSPSSREGQRGERGASRSSPPSSTPSRSPAAPTCLREPRLLERVVARGADASADRSASRAAPRARSRSERGPAPTSDSPRRRGVSGLQSIRSDTRADADADELQRLATPRASASQRRDQRHLRRDRGCRFPAFLSSSSLPG